MKIIGIDHVAVALRDLKELGNLLRELPGMQALGTEIVEDQGVKTDIYATRQGRVELLTPVKEDSPVDKYLRNRGPGIHHIALQVDDLEGMLQYCREKGIRLIDEKPRQGAGGSLIAFLHPKSTGGILIELCEKP
ncbi:MAG: methylmalonyl-CoA epimerase [FCB group bacterium]|nr:methylmalonyl-CoA epimerase [FCB group bacterium]